VRASRRFGPRSERLRSKTSCRLDVATWSWPKTEKLARQLGGRRTRRRHVAAICEVRHLRGLFRNVLHTAKRKALLRVRPFDRPRQPRPDVGHINVEVGRSVTDALQNLFADCRADATCNAKYPNLEASFAKATAGLDDEGPRPTFPVANALDPRDTRKYQAEPTGAAVFGLVTKLIANPVALPQLPMVIDGVARRDPAILALAQETAGSPAPGPGTSTGMPQSIRCSQSKFRPSELPSTGVDPIVDRYSRPVQLDQAVGCDFWPVPDVSAVFPTVKEPLRGAANTLVLTSRFDINIHPKYAAQVASRDKLPNAYLHTFHDRGHIVMMDACAVGVVDAFLINPTRDPDTSCIEKAPPVSWR
jgi:hypothetical protein